MSKSNCVFKQSTKNNFIKNFLEKINTVVDNSKGEILYAGVMLVDQVCGAKIPEIKDENTPDDENTPQKYHKDYKCFLKNIFDKLINNPEGLPSVNSILIENLESEYKNSRIIIYNKNSKYLLSIDDKEFEFSEEFLKNIFKAGIDFKRMYKSFMMHFETIKRINEKYNSNNHYMLLYPVTYSFIKNQTLLYLTLFGKTNDITKILEDKNGNINKCTSTIDFLISELLKNQIEHISLQFLSHSIKSSIAAIMSRNGSHNIGSHVLAAVGTSSIDLPDDQILFKYIQHRMDYIAQITTEIPCWTYSSLFVQDIMRRFFMQRHLLNNIARSEGLEAYEYQKRNPNGKVAKNKRGDEIEGKLIIKVKKSGSDKYFISPYGKIEEKLDALSLAIPGGVIGQHAFFAIMENIIRNSAKHEWSGDSSKRTQKNLEITIEYEDNPKNDFVVFRIWDNVSDVFATQKPENTGDKAKEAKKPPPDDSTKQCMDSTKLEVLPLHERLNCYLSKSFVDQDTGKLLQENWGLAEMKISAGYLNKKSIEEIGEDGSGVLFKQDGSKCTGLIRAIEIKDESNNETSYRLGFRFAVPKPKELLIIGNDIPEELIVTKAKESSVYFSKTDHKSLNYEFVLFQNDQCEKLKKNFEYWHYPHRLFCVCDGGKACDLKGKIVPVKESDLDKFKKDGEWNGNWDGLKLFLYRSCLDSRYLGKPNDEVRLYVNTVSSEGSGGDSGKSALGIFLDYYKDEIYESCFCDCCKDTYDQLIRDIKSGKKVTQNLDGFVVWLKNAFSSQSFNKGCDKIPEDYKNCLELIKILMIKYDERIETLPACFTNGTVGDARSSQGNNIWEPIKNEGLFDTNSKMELVSEKNNPNILYKRHGEPQTNSTALYQEALSGSQSYFTMLENPPEGYYKKKLALQLVENALAKILIIDERVANYYLDSSYEIKKRIKKAAMFIPVSFEYKSIKHTVVERDIDNSEQLILDDNNLFYNYIIIHQGILDKITPNRDSSEDEDTYRDNFISFLKKHCDLFVVTSGRGQPNTLKKDLKFLPFSNLESFLMKPYHEKFLLVQALNQVIRKGEAE